MGLRERYRQLPPHPIRQHRRDYLMGIIEAVVSSLERLAGATRRVKTPGQSDNSRVLRLADRVVVAHDENVVALTFTAADDTPLPRWHPGSHIDVHLPSGLIRQYSLCGDPADPGRYRIAVRRIPDGGGGSVEVHGLAVGDTVITHGPRNAFPLTVPGFGSPMRRFRFIAGGIGITPILSMLALAQQRDVEWSMIYAGRSHESLPFLDELAQYGERVHIRTDDGGPPSASDLLGDCPDGTAVYACGPAPMLTLIRSALVGRDDVELHFERFAAPPVVDGEEFSATLASSGAQVHVGAGETLLTALNRAGADARYSCQQGFCGTCRTRVLGIADGSVDHRDALLTATEYENQMMLICVSRGTRGSNLTLDL